MSSLYFTMKKANHSSLSLKPKTFVPKSSLLDDVNSGREPEKKHVTLDKFFK